ncbi:MAG: hypothetical protein K6E47_00245 [Lachnospiraceae bacterium]|nr:hypothetical protein [Lachnospiraceae bacterium]
MKKSRLLFATLLSLILTISAVLASGGIKAKANDLPADFLKASKRTTTGIEYYMDFRDLSIKKADNLPVSELVDYLYFENGDSEEPGYEYVKAYAVKWGSFWMDPVYNTDYSATVKVAYIDEIDHFVHLDNDKEYLPFAVSYRTISGIAIVFGDDPEAPISSNDTLYVIDDVRNVETLRLTASAYNTTLNKDMMVSSVSSNPYGEWDHLCLGIYDGLWTESSTAKVSFGYYGIYENMVSWGYTAKVYEGIYNDTIPSGAKDITDTVWRKDYSSPKTTGLTIKGSQKVPVTIVIYKNGVEMDRITEYISIKNETPELDIYSIGLFVEDDEEREDLNINKEVFIDFEADYDYNITLKSLSSYYKNYPQYLFLEARKGKFSSRSDRSFIAKAVEGLYDTLEDAKDKPDIKNLLFSGTVTKGFPIEEETVYYFTIFYSDGTKEKIRVIRTPSPNTTLRITENPKDTVVKKNALAYFNVKADGDDLKYLWQYKLEGSSKWEDWDSKNTASISVAYSSSRQHMKVRCVVTDKYNATKTSGEAMLTYSATNGISVDATNFPDQLFREYISSSYDPDGDGYIYPEEIPSITDISFANKENVTTLKGIEFFTELRTLKIFNNGLKSLDISKNTKLRRLLADGNKLTYLDISNNPELENTYLFEDFHVDTAEDMGYQYAIYGDDEVYSKNAITVDLNVQIETGTADDCDIVGHPEDVYVEHGKIAYFHASGYGKGLKYQWEYKLKGDSAWTPWSGKTTQVISVAYASYRNGMTLRCIATNKSGEPAESGEAVLTYYYYKPLKITQNPSSTTVEENKSAQFEVKAEGSLLSYLWQYKLADSDEWIDWTTKTTAKIDVAYASYRNGMKLRCVVTDITGDTRTSAEVELKYKKPTKMLKQPNSTTVLEKELAYFEVKAEGKGLKYLWQYKAPGSSTWTDWTSKTTSKISVAYASYRDGMNFRCVITDAYGNVLTSDPVTLSYRSLFKITADPLGTSAYIGEIATFEVKAVGTGLKYLWQYKLAGSTELTEAATLTYID